MLLLLLRAAGWRAGWLAGSNKRRMDKVMHVGIEYEFLDATHSHTLPPVTWTAHVPLGQAIASRDAYGRLAMASSSSSSGGGGVDLSRLSDDLLVNIFSRAEDDPRHLALLACVCRRFGYVVQNLCWRNRCMRGLPTIVPQVLEQHKHCHNQLGEPAGGWASLYRLLVCCPGLDSAGVLLESWDFGLERELYGADAGDDDDDDAAAQEQPRKKRIKLVGCGPHVASGSLSFSRELGNKLLASRFRTDSLYLCDLPGCVHPEERRKYKLFRGIFKNFKASQVCRNLRDLKARRTGQQCAFCLSTTMWDMVTSFCLRRSLEYHDDGEPVVRAYVCENGHVCGAWTDQPGAHVL